MILGGNISVLDFGFLGLLRGKLRKAFWVCLILLPAGGGAAQQPRPTTTRSPHGPLKMPCENCHTFTSWKPLRGTIEFDHNKTRCAAPGSFLQAVAREPGVHKRGRQVCGLPC